MESLYGNYRTRKFTDIWYDADEFISDFTGSPFSGVISADSLKLTYYLLYAAYGNSHIASSDETQFKYQLFTVIYDRGPTWEKKTEIQKKIRSLTDDEMLSGGQNVINHAYNPSGDPSTDAMSPLQQVNEQNVSGFKKGKPEAYATVWEILRVDLAKAYMASFKHLFLRIVEPELPLWYVTTTEEED